LADELKGPGVFEIRQFIKDSTIVEFYTVNDKILKGNILWYDGESFHMSMQNGQEITLLKNSVVYYSKA
jgi:hypothetical protein